MKKALCILLLLTTVLSLAAFSGVQGEKVMLYIPHTVEVYMGDGTRYAAVAYAFETDWKKKETFSVIVVGDADKIVGVGTTVYSKNKTVMDVGNGASLETRYNDQGQQILTVNHYADGGKREISYTYDDRGRIVSQVEKLFAFADSEPVVTMTDFILTDTETGFTITSTVSDIEIEEHFDQNGRQTLQISMVEGRELSRTEMFYDELGNMTSQISYTDGEKEMEIRYTWKAVKVSMQTAERLPQFKREI